VRFFDGYVQRSGIFGWRWIFVWRSSVRLAWCSTPSVSYPGAACWFVGSVGRFLVVVRL
jgi:hypothetical protein